MTYDKHGIWLCSNYSTGNEDMAVAPNNDFSA